MRKYLHRDQTELLIFFIFFVFALGIIGSHLLFHSVRVFGMDTSIFYMDEKYTLAAFFSTVTAFLVGYLALTNIGSKKPRIKWLANISYGLFFIGLSFDEYFEIHEYANTLVKANVNNDGVIKSLVNLSWIFPLSLIILIVFCLFFIKMKYVKTSVKLPMFLGVLCYALVLIFELLGSATYGKNIYLFFVAIEEGVEMIGTTFFLFATLLETKKLS
jgi:hypothetical protein